MIEMAEFDEPRSPVSTEFLRRIGCGIAGVAVLADITLLLGVSPLWWTITWSSGLQGIGILLWLLGFAGLLAPMCRRATQAIHTYVLWTALIIGGVVETLCIAFLDSSHLSWMGELKSVFMLIAWASMGGGICFLYTALAKNREWATTPTSALYNP